MMRPRAAGKVQLRHRQYSELGAGRIPKRYLQIGYIQIHDAARCLRRVADSGALEAGGNHPDFTDKAELLVLVGAKR